MRTVIIDGNSISAPEQLHDILSSGLTFPCWYGNNFDALHDCLTDIGEETSVIVRYFESMRINIGIKADIFRRVLIESSIENPLLSVIIE